MSEYLSPKLIKARKIYLKELGKIFFKSFNEKILINELKAKKNYAAQNIYFNPAYIGRQVKILFPVKNVKKKCRSIGFGFHKCGI